MTIKSFSSGSTIFTQGAPCQAAYVVVSGAVKLQQGDQTVRTAKAGETIGEQSLLHALPYEQTAIAEGEVSLQQLSFDKVQSLLDECPVEIQKMLMSLSRQPAASHGAGSEAAAMVPSAGPEAGMDSMAKMALSISKVTDLMFTRIEQLQKKIDEENTPESDLETSPVFNLTAQFVSQLEEMGPLKSLLEDDSINDILINGHDNIFVERDGLLHKTDISFPNDMAVLKVADKIVEMVGRKLDKTRPLVDARLLDGSRVNIIAPPLAVDGTSISIRKFSKRNITLDRMAEQGNLSESLSEFLKVLGKCRLNTLISGGTGSGKTTLLNAISQFIDPSERIVTIEDAAELKLQQPHVVRLETRPLTSGIGRHEEVTMRDLVRNALRMRPDRILVGEVRGSEAFDMMQAMNTGHEGSLTTIHANHPRDGLSRLENMISMANLQIPMKSLRYQIASALHVIVQISRMRDGHRRVTHISEVVGMEGDMITMHDLFNYVVEGEDANGQLKGHFKWSGIMPRFIRRILYYGEQDRIEKALGVKLPARLT